MSSGGTGSGAAAAGGAGADSASGGSDGSGGATVDDGKTTYVYVGSGSFGGENGLITVYTFDRDAGTLTFVSEHPAGGLASSIAIDEAAGRLYSGDESKNGVNSFTIDTQTGSLTALGPATSPNAPVYLSLTPTRDYLLAANYNQGNVDVYPIGQDGAAQASLGATATGENAHCVLIDAQNHVLVSNKGANTISHFDFSSGSLTPATPATTALQSPRHMFRHGDRLYVVSETADLITAFQVATDGALTKAWDTPRLPDGANAGNDTGADIQVTENGKFLYASNRGNSNTIVAYDIQGATPMLLEHEPTLGATPRNFELDPLDQYLIVGNQDGGSVVVFGIESDGKLTHKSTLDVEYSPFFVAIARF